MKLIFADTNVEVVEALKDAFYDTDVTYHAGRFEEVLGWDCVVSAANSYGVMDGGIDLAIRNFFGMSVQDKVQEMISRKWAGEQPVGTCEIVDVRGSSYQHRYVAHAPTMRVPQNVEGTLNAFLAMRAILLAVRDWNDGDAPRSTLVKSEYPHGPQSAETIYVRRGSTEEAIETVVCCGLATLTGGLAPRVAASQMRKAWHEVMIEQQVRPPVNWDFANMREQWLWAT